MKLRQETRRTFIMRHKMRDDKRFGVRQFMRDSILLRDTADRNSSCCAMLSGNELGSIVDYLATM